jgi:hypothetical protein
MMLAFRKDGFVNGCLRCRPVKLVYQKPGCIEPFLQRLFPPKANMVSRFFNLHAMEDSFVKRILFLLLVHVLKILKITMNMEDGLAGYAIYSLRIAFDQQGKKVIR